MPARINTREEPYYTQRTRLEGRDYVLKFAYNEREERWHLSLFDEEKEPIATGIKLVANWPLLVRYRYDERTPPGEIVCSDISGDASPPKLLELGEGKRCELIYFTSEELAELTGG